MDPVLSDEQQFFQETTRKFLEQECPLPTVRAWATRPDGFDPAWWRQAAELGFTSFLVAEADGGGNLSGRGLLDLAIVAEEMGRLVSPGPLVPTNVVAGAVSAAGSDEQRRRVLPGILAGERIAAWTGPGAGITARAEGDTQVLDGASAAVEAGAQAHDLLVTAQGPTGPTQLLLPADAPGLTVTPLEGFDLVRRFARVELDGVRVDAATVVGEVGGAEAAVDRQIRVATVLRCAETSGAIDRVLAFTVEYLGDRYSFGRPLSSYQALKHRLADMKLWLEASHAITTLAATAVDHDAPDAEEIVHAAAAYVHGHASELVQQAAQLHGGIGVTWEADLHVYLRRVTTNRNVAGTPADHRRALARVSLRHLEDA
jgi:alkylation response protein AidB-like acyl-CoA dehydrogenase